MATLDRLVFHWEFQSSTKAARDQIYRVTQAACRSDRTNIHSKVKVSQPYTLKENPNIYTSLTHHCHFQTCLPCWTGNLLSDYAVCYLFWGYYSFFLHFVKLMGIITIIMDTVMTTMDMVMIIMDMLTIITVTLMMDPRNGHLSNILEKQISLPKMFIMGMLMTTNLKNLTRKLLPHTRLTPALSRPLLNYGLKHLVRLC